MTLLCISWNMMINLVKMCQAVHEICRQVFFCLKFSSLNAEEPWKLSQGHQNLFSQLFIMSQCHSIYTQIWLKSANRCIRYCSYKQLYRNKYSKLSPGVILKIRWRSPKHNQLLIMSWCYMHEYVVKICQSVHNLMVQRCVTAPH